MIEDAGKSKICDHGYIEWNQWYSPITPPFQIQTLNLQA